MDAEFRFPVGQYPARADEEQARLIRVDFSLQCEVFENGGSGSCLQHRISVDVTLKIAPVIPVAPLTWASVTSISASVIPNLFNYKANALDHSSECDCLTVSMS